MHRSRSDEGHYARAWRAGEAWPYRGSHGGARIRYARSYVFGLCETPCSSNRPDVLEGVSTSKPSCTVFRFGCGSLHRARIFMSHFFPEHKTKGIFFD
jgi:hypothetical protein